MSNYPVQFNGVEPEFKEMLLLRVAQACDDAHRLDFSWDAVMRDLEPHEEGYSTDTVITEPTGRMVIEYQKRSRPPETSGCACGGNCACTSV